MYLGVTFFHASSTGDNHEKLAQAVVNEMRQKIEEKTQLTASAGEGVAG